LGLGLEIRRVAALAAGGDILQRILHSGMRSSLIGGRVVAGVAQVAESPKACEVCQAVPSFVNRVLCLGLMAVLARRRLRTALGADLLGRQQEENPHRDQESQPRYQEIDR